MPKILVNYKYNKKTDSYTLLNNDVVFADLPVAVMEMTAEYDEILVVPIQNVKTVVDKVEYLKVHKQFKLVVNEDGSLKEDANGVPVYLPKETDISKLKFMNGQLVLVEEKKKEVEEVVEEIEKPEGE